MDPTCAVARLVMSMFDVKWLRVLDSLKIRTELCARYMDDGRVVLYPLRCGWRMVGTKLQYCGRWAREDKVLSSTEVTRRVIEGQFHAQREFQKILKLPVSFSVKLQLRYIKEKVLLFLHFRG